MIARRAVSYGPMLPGDTKSCQMAEVRKLSACRWLVVGPGGLAVEVTRGVFGYAGPDWAVEAVAGVEECSHRREFAHAR